MSSSTKVIVSTVRTKAANFHFIGRPSALGNPFYMANESQRNVVCDKYEVWFKEQILNNNPKVLAELELIKAKMNSNSPVNLQCFCAPRRCHGDTIANFLNK